MNDCIQLKKLLNRNIKKLAIMKSDFLFKPDKDFTLSGKLDFISIVRLIISMEPSSLKDELLKYFDYSVDIVSVSAFVQARSKIKFDAFEWLFRSFNDISFVTNLYKIFRLIAIDGSSIPISYDKSDLETYCANHGIDSKGFNEFHLTAAYDLLEYPYDEYKGIFWTPLSFM